MRFYAKAFVMMLGQRTVRDRTKDVDPRAYALLRVTISLEIAIDFAPRSIRSNTIRCQELQILN